MSRLPSPAADLVDAHPRPTIRPRRAQFDWEDTPLHWVPDDPFTTHVINVLHLLLPAGERWFCDVLRDSLPLIEDEQLRADVKGFIAQEAIHARAHSAVLDHLRAQGVETEGFTNFMEWMFKWILSDRLMIRPLRRHWLEARLGIVAGLEHFTCVMGQWVLSADALDEAGADPTMLDLLRWHGAEEVEHRSVAFDVLQEVAKGRGRYGKRVFGLVTGFPVLMLLFDVGTRYLIKRDPTITRRVPRYRNYIRKSRAGLLPVGRLFVAAPRFLRPAHHPEREGSLQPALDYLAISPAATAAVAKSA